MGKFFANKLTFKNGIALAIISVFIGCADQTKVGKLAPELPKVDVNVPYSPLLNQSLNSPTRASFDGKGHFLLQGVPRFVRGVYDTGFGYTPNEALWEQEIFTPGGNLRETRGLQNFPFNVYLNYQLGNADINSTFALMNVLQKHNMMYIQTGNCFFNFGIAPGSFRIQDDNYVRQFATHRGAFGYYIMDECNTDNDNLLSATQSFSNHLNSVDPVGLTLEVGIGYIFRNLTPWVNAANLVGIDSYPMWAKEPAAGFPHFEVADLMARTRMSVPPDRPIINALQFFRFDAWNKEKGCMTSRLPNYNEMRAHAIMSVVEGAQGLFWWEVGENGIRKVQEPGSCHPNLTDQEISASMNNLQKLVTEVASLEQILLAPSSPGALIGNSTKPANTLQAKIAARITQLQHNAALRDTVFNAARDEYLNQAAKLQAGNTSGVWMLNDVANVRTMVKIIGGKGYVFAYNYLNSTVPVTFTWQQNPGSVTEYDGSKNFSVSGSSWSDLLAPYQSRIYVISNPGTGGTTGPAPTPTPIIPAPTPTPSATPRPTPTPTPTPKPPTATPTPIPPSPTPTPSLQPFKVSVTQPTAGSVVKGDAVWVVIWQDGASTSSNTYTITIGGRVVATQVSSDRPASIPFNSTSLPNGTQTMQVTVKDAMGRTASTSMSINIQNFSNLLPLKAAITGPGDGSIVSGSSWVIAWQEGAPNANNTFTVTVAGRVVATQVDAGRPASINWDSRSVPNGLQTLQVTVKDAAGRTASSRISVNVKN